MIDKTYDLKLAFKEVSASSAGGSPFLIAYGATFLITAILSFFLPRQTVALIAMFQGGIALPVAFWLERRMGSARMSHDNPLRSLSAQMAMSQALGLPILILVYSLKSGGHPVGPGFFGRRAFSPLRLAAPHAHLCGFIHHHRSRCIHPPALPGAKSFFFCSAFCRDNLLDCIPAGVQACRQAGQRIHLTGSSAGNPFS